MESKIKFKRGYYLLQYSVGTYHYQDLMKGYWVEIDGEKSKYFIDKDSDNCGWTCWDIETNEMYCGGLTLGDTKETFKRIINKF